MKSRVLMLALAVVLLTTGCDGSGGDPDPDPSAAASSGTSGSASGSPTADPGPVVTCPDATLLDPDPALPDAVPEGATSVRLCDGGDDKVTPPVDALTTDVASVVTAINVQPVVKRNCVDRRIPEYNLAFGYPDGTTFTVAGRFTGCAELLVGSARRARAKPPLRAFIDELLAQRGSATPPSATDPATLDCAQPHEYWTEQLARPTGLAVAVLCYGQIEHPGKARRASITRDQLAILTDSMRTDTYSSGGSLGCSTLPRREYWIVGTNTWGDPITMTKGCWGLTVASDEEWSPRRQARQIVRDLVDQAR